MNALRVMINNPFKKAFMKKIIMIMIINVLIAFFDFS